MKFIIYVCKITSISEYSYSSKNESLEETLKDRCNQMLLFIKKLYQLPLYFSFLFLYFKQEIDLKSSKALLLAFFLLQFQKINVFSAKFIFCFGFCGPNIPYSFFQELIFIILQYKIFINFQLQLKNLYHFKQLQDNLVENL